MVIAAKIKHFLDSHHIAYRVLTHERTTQLREAALLLNIAPHQIIQAVLLKDDAGICLALLPLDTQINLEKLCKKSQRPFKILPPKEADKFFTDCEPGSYPPLGKAYGIPMILDTHLAKLDILYFKAGSHTALIQLTGDDFHFLTGVIPSYAFTEVNVNQDNAPSPSFSWEDARKIGVIVDFPEVPPVARQVLAIAKHDSSQEAILALSNLIANETLISKHILECAGCYLEKEMYVREEEKREWLPEVISKIFGFETVSHIAVGITAGRMFQVPKEGPLGLHTFWQHSLQSALLAKNIAERIPESYGVDPRLSYLVGFFHNFGYLLLGHLFPHEFRLLNRWMLLNPKIPVEILEKRLLGMGQAMAVIGNGHARLGACLMQYWSMPELIVTTTAFHHIYHYQGIYDAYVHLVQLTNQLLKATGLGDGQLGTPSEICLKALGLKLSVVEACVEAVQRKVPNLNRLAKELAN